MYHNSLAVQRFAKHLYSITILCFPGVREIEFRGESSVPALNSDAKQAPTAVKAGHGYQRVPGALSWYVCVWTPSNLVILGTNQRVLNREVA